MERVSGRARRIERRNEAEEDPRDDRRETREGEHRRIDSYLRGARQVLGSQTQEKREGSLRDDEAERAACGRERQALAEELTGEPRAVCAERRADGQLPPASGRARQQEIRDVRAADEQQEADGAGQQQDGGPRVADDGPMERHDVHAESGVCVRVRSRQPRGDGTAARRSPPRA